MKTKSTQLFALIAGLFLLFNTALAQSKVSGKVTDASTNTPMTGVNIVVKGYIAGTTTDDDGNFNLTTSIAPPFTLSIQFIGFKSKEIEIKDANTSGIEVALEESWIFGEEIVVSASKVEESIMEAPITIEKMNLVELRSTPSFDAYNALANLKGVQANTGSITFTSVNTRGFADMQNWRFVQLIDGMDASSPGLNYPVGGASGPADIDIESIEVVPGANSALYGANAFNGLLTLNTKSPFMYQGLSAYMKGGVTVQDAAGTNPLGEFGLRYAKTLNKFAFKVNFGYLKATDWTANDESFYINITRSADPASFLSKPRNDPNFDAVNVYGDEVVARANLGAAGTNVPINRTGIREKDIIDYGVATLKADGAIHYRPNDKLEASYSYRFIQSDAILRHTTMYPFVNWVQQFHRVELKGSNWNLKSFYSVEDAADTYFLLATGSFIEQGRKSNTIWAADYGAAFRGEVSGVNGNDHDAARIYADRDMPAIGSAEFNSLRSQSLNNTDVRTGGSKLITNTSLTSVDGNYTFNKISKVLDLQVGGGYRNYKLDSKGVLFNDGPIGFFNGPIPVQEYGAYLQAGKKLFKDHLSIRGSMRYDKRPEFKGRITPRIAGVYSIDQAKNHNIRASYQTGFRNPASQEGYIALDINSAILLGGIERNVENYNYVKADGNTVNGTEIHGGLVTLASYQAYAAGGSTNPSLLVPANLSYLKQEKNTSYDIGYKGLIGKKLFIDANYYYTMYTDLVVRITTFSPTVARAYAVYTNIKDDVTSQGAGLGLEYFLNKGYSIGFNYTYTSFDGEKAVENNPGFLPSFNTPENRFNVSMSNSGVGKSNFGFNIKYRWWDGYNWQSPFGVGVIDSKGIVDMALTYKIQKMQSMVKVGASNMFGNEYKTVYGGPTIGSIYFVSWTYDQIFRR